LKKGKNKRKTKYMDVNMIPKMWGWTGLNYSEMPSGGAPWVFTQQLPFFLNGEVKPQDGSPKNHSRKFHVRFWIFIYLFIFTKLFYFIA
jgi:hypothetical protein